MFKIITIISLMSGLLINHAIADETLFKFTMEENSFAPRAGTIEVILPTEGTSPFTSNPNFSFLDAGVTINAQWESICGTNVFLAGGQLTGWLLGPINEGAVPGLGIDNLHNEFRQIFGLGSGFTASTLFAVIAGEGAEIPDAGVASRFPCDGSVNFADFAFLYIFVWPNATTFADKGFYIGDVFYFTEIGIQHYFLYNATPLL